jgi:hypothetical protein
MTKHRSPRQLGGSPKDEQLARRDVSRRTTRGCNMIDYHIHLNGAANIRRSIVTKNPSGASNEQQQQSLRASTAARRLGAVLAQESGVQETGNRRLPRACAYLDRSSFISRWHCSIRTKVFGADESPSEGGKEVRRVCEPKGEIK